MKGYIYKLVCPNTKKPIYIGSTIKPLKIRFSQHLVAIGKSELPLYVYLSENGIIPKIVKIKEVDVDSPIKLRRLEGKFIDLYKKRGHALLNLYTPSRDHNASSKYENIKIPINARGGSLLDFLSFVAKKEYRWPVGNQVIKILERYIELNYQDELKEYFQATGKKLKYIQYIKEHKL